jgi:hypothetical protein
MSLTFWAGTHDPSQAETVQIDYNVDLDTTPPHTRQYAVTATAPSGAVKVRGWAATRATTSLSWMRCV